MSNYWDDELYHYGVVGMRWGVIKRQNKATLSSYKNHISKQAYKTAYDKRGRLTSL